MPLFPAFAPLMTQALAEARQGEGLTRPNPPVGCVIVRDGEVVARGHHAKAGGPHAEIVALGEAGEAARGHTLVVSLEPCCTTGRTGPCTEAIVAAGVATVVVGTTDPNPAHAGRGLEWLRRRGVEVIGPDPAWEAECQEIIRPFSTYIRESRAHVTLKLATTLDGRIADAEGHSRWITGEAARAEVQALRRRADVIMVGAETIRRDDPELLPRPDEGREPFRLVVTASGHLPPEARVFTDPAAARTWIARSRACQGVDPRSRAGSSRAESRGQGMDLTRGTSENDDRSGSPLPSAAFEYPGDHVPLADLLRDVAFRGMLHVLCEGGGRLAAGLLEEGLVDDVVWFVAPRLLGASGRPAVAGGWTLGDAPGFRIIRTATCGPDVRLDLRRIHGEEPRMDPARRGRRE